MLTNQSSCWLYELLLDLLNLLFFLYSISLNSVTTLRMTAHLLQWKYWEITICINYLSFLLKVIFRDWVVLFFFPFINNSFGDGGCLVCYSEFTLFSIHCDSCLWSSQENNGSSSSVFFPGCSVMCSGSLLAFPLTEVGSTFICHWWNCRGFFAKHS